MVSALGRFQLLGCSAAAVVGAPVSLALIAALLWLCDQVDPVALDHDGPDQVADRASGAPRTRVLPSTSGPWWAARPSTCRTGAVGVEVLDQHLDGGADPLLGAVAVERGDQVGHVLRARARISSSSCLPSNVSASVPSSSE